MAKKTYFIIETATKYSTPAMYSTLEAAQNEALERSKGSGAKYAIYEYVGTVSGQATYSMILEDSEGNVLKKLKENGNG